MKEKGDVTIYFTQQVDASLGSILSSSSLHTLIILLERNVLKLSSKIAKQNNYLSTFCSCLTKTNQAETNLFSWAIGIYLQLTNWKPTPIKESLKCKKKTKKQFIGNRVSWL